jgi:tetratricopeptide (TPR) repeat protein
MILRLTGVIAVLVASICAPALADAIDPPTRARALSDQGRQYHDAADYDRAIASYKEAYELAPSPGLLFNMGQAYRLKGDCDDAAIMYRSYLRSDPDRPERDLTRTHLVTVENCMARRTMLHPLLGDRAAGKAATAAAGGIDQPAVPGRRLKRAGLAVGIGGGALVGVGIYFAVQASDASSEVERLIEMGAKWKDVKELDARGRRDSTLATVFAVGGGAAAIAGGVMYLMGRNEAKRAEGRKISIAPTPGGGQVSVAWDF